MNIFKKIKEIFQEEKPEFDILKHMEVYVFDKINTITHNKDYYLEVFNRTGQNFVRLGERFKHDEIKLKEISEDRYTHLLSQSGIFYESPLYAFGNNEDIERLRKEQEIHRIKFEEIEKKIESYLGDDYLDYRKIQS